MPYQWPTELDNADRLLTVVGSFWSDTYAGNELVSSMLHSVAQHHAQLHLDLLELIAAMSRFNVPVFHRENWALLTLRESELNDPNIAAYDGTYLHDGTIHYDQPLPSLLFAWPAPSDLVQAKVILNQITDATLTCVNGIDFFLQNGALWFRDNPFDQANVRIETIFEAGEPVDRVAYLWAYGGDYDWDTIYKQFGYVIGLRLASSANFRKTMNAIFNGLVAGTSAACVQDMMSAICDVPLAAEDETVRHILLDQHKRWVITDNNAYGFHPDATVLVEEGDEVLAGDSLTDTLQFFDFNRGEVPADIRALVLGRGLLAEGYFQELIFENTTVAVTVTENVDGYTKLEFPLGGWPLDVEKFWDDTHAAGVASDDTLAMRFDTRPGTPDTQPTAIALPTTINPMQFLLENILRGNAFAILAKPLTFGPQSLGLHVARFLSKLVPPQTVCLLITQVAYDGDVVVMDGPGDETTPGYEEDVAMYLGQLIEETINPDDYISEEVRIYQIGGYCA